jgi:hypothetical protein
MPHYKDSNNQVYWLDSIEMEHLLPVDAVNISDNEVEVIKALKFPPKTGNAALLEQIGIIEASVTPRRLREAALTEAGKAWLADVDSQIAVLRNQLVK